MERSTFTRGRFAPSPSGRMHLGNVFCALISWLSVRSVGGEMLLRIEDLDTARCKSEYTAQLLDDLQYLGLTFDNDLRSENPFFRQSKRTEVYEAYCRILEEKGVLYPCFCSRDELHVAGAPHAADGRTLYSGRCRALSAAEIAEKSKEKSPAYRLAVPKKTTTFTDGVFGTQSSKTDEEWGDFIIRRSDGLFAYQLAVVVDDAEMGITEVVRGRDLLSSCAPQLLLYSLLEKDPPHFSHIPLLLSSDGRRLSKRDRDLDMKMLRERFPSPEPLIGRLLYLSGIVDRVEPLSAKEAISEFSWDRLIKSDIILDTDRFFAGKS